VSSRLAELQTLLEGVPLPADKQELIRYAVSEGAGPGEAALLEALPDREFRSIDDVGEALQPVQPGPSSEPGRVRER